MELPTAVLAERFLSLCEDYGSQRLVVDMIAAARSTGVRPQLPESDDWTTWDADHMRAAIDYLQQKRGVR